MDDTKREELEKACKEEKNHKIRARMVAVRMMRVLNMSVEETASLQVRCPTRGFATGRPLPAKSIRVEPKNTTQSRQI